MHDGAAAEIGVTGAAMPLIVRPTIAPLASVMYWPLWPESDRLLIVLPNNVALAPFMTMVPEL